MMTESTERELLAIITFIAIPLGFLYVFCLALRWTILAVNRGIDRNWNAAHPPMGHRIYPEPGEPDDYWRDCYARDAERMERDERSERDRVDAGRRATHGGMVWASPRLAIPVKSLGRPRLARPVVVVAHGRHAGARVRLLMESKGYPGTWVAEVVESAAGDGRGLVVIEGDDLRGA